MGVVCSNQREFTIPKLGFIWKKTGKKLISTDYGRYGSQYSPKKKVRRGRGWGT